MKTQRNVGDKVICNGFPGVVTKVCDGQLSGMLEVSFDSGSGTVCVSDDPRTIQERK